LKRLVEKTLPRKPTMYCGNKENRCLDPKNNCIEGNLHKCYMKGLVIGKNVKPRKNIYCGNLPDIPDGYDEFGTRYTCLQRGIKKSQLYKGF